MIKEASYLKLKQYFADLVGKSRFLNDFSGFFLRELQNKESSFEGIASPFLALFDYSLGMEGDDIAPNMAVRKIKLGILRNDVPPDDYEKQYSAIDEMERFAVKVASRLRYDSNDKEHFLYGTFLKNTLEIHPVELDGDGIFGVELSFDLKNTQSLKLNPNDWKDIEKVC